MSNVIGKSREGHIVKTIEGGVEISVPLPFELKKSDVKGKAPFKKDILSVGLGVSALGILAIASPFVHVSFIVVIVAFFISAILLGFAKRVSIEANEEQERNKQVSIHRISRELLGPWLREQGFKKSENLALRILTNGETYATSNNAWKVENIHLKFVNGVPTIIAYDWS